MKNQTETSVNINGFAYDLIEQGIKIKWDRVSNNIAIEIPPTYNFDNEQLTITPNGKMPVWLADLYQIKDFTVNCHANV